MAGKTVNKDNVFFGEGKEAYRRLQTYHHIQSYFLRTLLFAILVKISLMPIIGQLKSRFRILDGIF